MNDVELEALLKAANTHAPNLSKRKKRSPFTVEILTSIREQFNLTDSRDAAVWACATTIFWAVARVGEFTVTKLPAFDAAVHVTRRNIREATDRSGLTETVFAIPRTKSAPGGEDVFWARQEGPTDPQAALENHLMVNNPAATEPLFGYKHQGSVRPLTRAFFLSHLSKAAERAGLQPLQGHGLRIGGTLEYLLRGVPFDVVKSKGRWASDAFTLYLRRHAEIMAPYMQAVPAVHESFVRYAMPPVR
ncbi:hypothetical protein A0H81_06525 [Grifola frondosa]|uniref:Tyr recombinase domain-containing protein n=1 Tax=Grifola frondosa TaxID=5627 RepID=A0A1C7MB42_GRIFR|nr:hypothetical protein A0H81_06525 [Grifola frondosa]